MARKSYYSPPVRPPRTTKEAKDKSGRLMNIIAELSVSKSNEDRKRKMSDLKKDFEASDGRLVHLISGSRDQLSVTMESFSKISAKINASKQKCANVKEKLEACKKLLECRRDEIRRLWTESVEHREVISILKKIEDLNKVHDQIECHLKKSEFQQATQLLVSAISLLEGKLSQADALKDVKDDLNSLRRKQHHMLIQEIHKCLYEAKPEIATEKPTNGETNNEEKTYDELFSNKKCLIKRLPMEGSYDFSCIESNYNKITVILECAALLSTLPETVEILKDNCSKELLRIIRNLSELMYNNLKNSSYVYKEEPLFSVNQNPEQSRFLFDLLQAILNQFKCVAVNHYALLDNLERIAMTKNIPDLSQIFDMADIYSKMESALEIFVGNYLDIHNTTTTQRTAAFAKVPAGSVDISSFFLRKGVNRPKKHSLFKFDSSNHAINKMNYLQEQKNSIKEKSDLEAVEADRCPLVAEPNPKNIITVYKPLKNFISEIEICASLRMESGTHGPLHAFLTDCVKVFLDQVSSEVNRLMERTTISLDAWKPVNDADDLKLAEAKTQILNSSVSLNSNLKEMEELIYALPDYSSHFLQLICNILQSYKELCNGAYKNLIYADTAEERIFSLSWARDPDISRLLRSLPNWTNLEVDDSDDANDFEEAPEEIRFRNKEESEILIRNLSNKDSISPSEIILEHQKLKNLALMHESMEWFSSKIIGFSEKLPDVQASMPSLFHSGDENGEIGISTTTKGCLKKLARDFKDLADTCLLVLHLEVRAHCFFYLLQLSKESYVNRKDDEEPEIEVVKLNADLSKIDETLSPILQPKKMRYVFEGLGELLSTILINCVSNIKKINENGVKKMGRNIFAIQQNLAGITMTREVALDRARQYFDLLNHTYEDILNQIVEEGPQFQELDYTAVIQLLHNSREGVYEQESLNCYLDRLRQILDEVAVSV